MAAAHADGNEDFMVLLKSGHDCQSEDLRVGVFDNALACARAVKAAGGKFFIFGLGIVRGGRCYIEYTHSRDCPEGFSQSNSLSRATLGEYHFYELPDVELKDVLQCKIDVVLVENPSESGVLTRTQYRDSSITLLQSQGVYTNLALRKYFCNWEHKLSCLAGVAEVIQYEACCSLGWFGRSCSITTPLQEAGRTDLSKRGDEWTQNKESGYTKFEAEPPTSPALPQISSGDSQFLTVSVGGVTTTVREEFNRCPSWINTVLNGFSSLNQQSYDFYSQFIPASARNHPIAYVFGKSQESSLLDPAVFDTYTLGMVVAGIHLQLRRGAATMGDPKDLVAIPSRQDFLDRFYVNGLRGSAFPEIDEESGGFLDSAFEFGEVCIMDSFREMPTNDGFQNGENSWSTLLSSDSAETSHCPYGQSQCTKKEFILGVFAEYQTVDGSAAYPPQQIDFRGSYYKADLWEDAADTFLAFGHLAMHRTRHIASAEAPTHNGQSAAFVVSTCALGALSVRTGFARLGADMFFSSSKEPIMIRTPNGDEIWRSQAPSATWQYWKFVWRSSVFLKVTLVDHLWMTHYSAANSLTAASREALPAIHPLRRLLSMFTHGSIEVNYRATHQLIGPDHLLQRSSPFKDFYEVAKGAQTLMLSMKEAYGAFVDENIFNAMDPSLKSLPLYQDGRLLYQGIDTLINRWSALYRSEWCGDDGNIKDRDIKFFMNRLDTWTLFGNTADSDREWLGLRSSSGELLCVGFYAWLKTILFAVSGYHRHVGTVADIASDPDFASFSNVEGEAFGRPRQHMQMALIAGSTARIFPKIVADYTFLAQDLVSGATEASQILRDFQIDMQKMAVEVDRRNEQRSVAYLQMHPNYVEPSVAV